MSRSQKKSWFVSPFDSELKEVAKLPVKHPGSEILKPDVSDQYKQNILKKISNVNSLSTLLDCKPKKSATLTKKGWFVSPFDSEINTVTKLPVKRPCSEILQSDTLDEYNDDNFKKKKNWFVSPFDSELKEVAKLPVKHPGSEILKLDVSDQYNHNILKKMSNVNSLSTSLDCKPKKTATLTKKGWFVSPFDSELKTVTKLPVKRPCSETLQSDAFDEYNDDNFKKKKGWPVSSFDSKLKEVTKLPVKHSCSEILKSDALDQYNDNIFKKTSNNNSLPVLLECEPKKSPTLANKSWFVSPFDSELKKVTKLPIECPTNILKLDDLDRYNEDIFKKANKVNSLPTWLLECQPKECSELAVSRQKQQELSSWFVKKIQQRQPSILIVSGPSGCGKTVAVRVIAKENGYNVVEWINPIDQAIDENYKITRQGQVFEDFLIRTTRYSSISSSSTRQLLLVKDFPNAYIREKESFFAVLEKYSELGKEPVVFICTESGSSRLQHTLFPPEIQQKFNISVINVNSVTQAAMKKALQRTSGILNSTASRYINVSQHEINEILSNNTGDIRGAVLNLIFISLKVPKKLTRTKKESSGRDENIGLLHAIGRVINPKRIQDDDLWKFVYNPDDIALFFQSQATTFLSFLQENYLNTIGQFEDVVVGSDILSLSDILNSEWRDISLSRTTLSFCVRGIMVANQKPVSGWNPVRKPHSERLNLQRRLCTAEVRWYESIINAGTSKDETKFNNTEFEGHIE